MYRNMWESISHFKSSELFDRNIFMGNNNKSKLLIISIQQRMLAANALTNNIVRSNSAFKLPEALFKGNGEVFMFCIMNDYDVKTIFL